MNLLTNSSYTIQISEVDLKIGVRTPKDQENTKDRAFHALVDSVLIQHNMQLSEITAIHYL